MGTLSSTANNYPQHVFLWRNKTYQQFLDETAPYLGRLTENLSKDLEIFGNINIIYPIGLDKSGIR